MTKSQNLKLLGAHSRTAKNKTLGIHKINSDFCAINKNEYILTVIKNNFSAKRHIGKWTGKIKEIVSTPFCSWCKKCWHNDKFKKNKK